MDEACIVKRNKARLVVKGYSQEEGIDYDENLCTIYKIRGYKNLSSLCCSYQFQSLPYGCQKCFSE